MESVQVIVDLVATLFFESEGKIANAEEALQEGKWAASIYYSYQSMVNSAKALLTAEKTKTNTHSSIIRDFDKLFVDTDKVILEGSFEDLVLEMNKKAPTEDFANAYLSTSKEVLRKFEAYRQLELQEA